MPWVADRRWPTSCSGAAATTATKHACSLSEGWTRRRQPCLRRLLRGWIGAVPLLGSQVVPERVPATKWPFRMVVQAAGRVAAPKPRHEPAYRAFAASLRFATVLNAATAKKEYRARERLAAQGQPACTRRAPRSAPHVKPFRTVSRSRSLSRSGGATRPESVPRDAAFSRPEGHCVAVSGRIGSGRGVSCPRSPDRR